MVDTLYSILSKVTTEGIINSPEYTWLFLYWITSATLAFFIRLYHKPSISISSALTTMGRNISKKAIKCLNFIIVVFLVIVFFSIDKLKYGISASAVKL